MTNLALPLRQSRSSLRSDSGGMVRPAGPCGAIESEPEATGPKRQSTYPAGMPCALLGEARARMADTLTDTAPAAQPSQGFAPRAERTVSNRLVASYQSFRYGQPNMPLTINRAWPHRPA
jgi:hypothetical protein